MKKIIFTFLFVLQFVVLSAQDIKPHFAAVHFSPVFESIKKLKTGFGTSLEGAYFLNEWFGAGGKFSFSSHNYVYPNFKSSGSASQFGFSGNVFILKRMINDKISIIPSIGIGFMSTGLPSGTLTTTELKETAPGIFSEVAVENKIGATNITSFMFNVFGFECNYHFKPNMSAGINLEYQISASTKWPDETLGDFFSIGIGYTYFFGIK